MLAKVFFFVVIICQISAIHFGSMAAIKEFPYMVEILKNEYHKCGGSLITELFVITAAHCIMWQEYSVGNFANYLLQAGTTLVGKKYGPNSQRRTISKFVVHYDFDVVENHDVGIIKATKKFDLNPYVNVVKLPNENQVDYYIGETVVGAGWGQDARDKIPPALKKMEAKIQKYRYCRKKYDKEILCARGKDEAVMCWGDSGGPLTVHNIDNPKDDILVGVFTNMRHWNINRSCIKDTDITMVNVAYVIDWVVEVKTKG